MNPILKSDHNMASGHCFLLKVHSARKKQSILIKTRYTLSGLFYQSRSHNNIIIMFTTILYTECFQMKTYH